MQHLAIYVTVWGVAALLAFSLFGWMLASPHAMETGEVSGPVVVGVVLGAVVFVAGLASIVRHHLKRRSR